MGTILPSEGLQSTCRIYSSMIFLTSTLSTRGDEDFTRDQGEKHIYERTSWSSPIMGILGLRDQKLERENAEDTAEQENFLQLCPGRTRSLAS